MSMSGDSNKSMRLDSLISDLGIIKRRTVAKEMADAGHIHVNDRKAKPSQNISVGDIIAVKGKHSMTVKILKLPEGRSIPKAARERYYEVIEGPSRTSDE